MLWLAAGARQLEFAHAIAAEAALEAANGGELLRRHLPATKQWARRDGTTYCKLL